MRKRCHSKLGESEYRLGEHCFKHRTQWVFFWPHWVPGRELSEFLSTCYLCTSELTEACEPALSKQCSARFPFGIAPRKNHGGSLFLEVWDTSPCFCCLAEIVAVGNLRFRTAAICALMLRFFGDCSGDSDLPEVGFWPRSDSDCSKWVFAKIDIQSEYWTFKFWVLGLPTPDPRAWLSDLGFWGRKKKPILDSGCYCSVCNFWLSKSNIAVRAARIVDPRSKS